MILSAILTAIFSILELKKTLHLHVHVCSTRGSRKFCQRGFNSDGFFVCLFFSDEEKRIQIALKAGHHRPTSETPFKWGFTGGPMMAQHKMLAR